MEHMAGGDLQQMMSRNGYKVVPISTARKIIKQVCQALVYLHSRSIIHRDIKLENVMLSSKNLHQCEAKLADFGMALRLEETSQALRQGTIEYAAPEVIDPEQSYGPPADIWSLGVTLHLMLTVKLPARRPDRSL